MPNVRLRPIALPTEHGGWALVGAPILLGLWVAPSVSGACLGVASLAVFLARQPAGLALGDWRRGRRYPRTAWAAGFALGYVLVALSAFACAWVTARGAFWLPLALAAPLALAGGPAGAIAGVLAWGVGMGAQESVVRAAVAGMAPPERRGSAYGTFNMAYGVSWFVGSAAGGWLYTRSPMWLAGFSLVLQVAAIPVLLAAARARRVE